MFGMSIYLCSKRPDGLKRLVHSLGCPNCPLAIVAGIDKGTRNNYDDVQHVEIIELPETNPFKSVAGENYLVKKVEPFSHIWVLNDDAYISGEWEKQAFSVPQKFLGQCSDIYFPILTRSHYEKLGQIYPSQFKNWGADDWLVRAYANRTRRVDIRIIHEQDIATRSRMTEISGDYFPLLKNVPLLWPDPEK